MSFHLPVILAILLEGGLDRCLQFLLVVIEESDELEGLKAPGDGTQHFCRAKH
ncbi:MAG: hypothetical protein ABSE28_07585 [Candidatus Sulfotelmatobacter sp.]